MITEESLRHPLIEGTLNRTVRYVMSSGTSYEQVLLSASERRALRLAHLFLHRNIVNIKVR